MKRGGRRAAALVLALGVSVIAVSLWTARMSLLELWYLRKLAAGSAEEKKSAASALGKMGSVRAIPRLLKVWVDEGAPSEPQLMDRRAEVASSALDCIARIGAKALPSLSRALGAPEIAARPGAVFALCRLGPPAAPLLLTTFEGEDAQLKSLALSCLGHVELPGAAESIAESVDVSVEKLVDHLQHRVLTFLAARALIAMGGRAVPALFKRLVDDESDVQREAARILAQMRPPAVRALKQAFSEGSKQCKKAIASGVRGIGPLGRELVPEMVDSAADPDLRPSALSGLGFIGAEPALALPVLIACLKDSSVHARHASAYALGGFGPAGAPAVPALIEALGDDNPGVRSGALSSLADIGPPAQAALPTLRELLGSKDEIFRSLAATAIAKIEAGAPAP